MPKYMTTSVLQIIRKRKTSSLCTLMLLAARNGVEMKKDYNKKRNIMKKCDNMRMTC